MVQVKKKVGLRNRRKLRLSGRVEAVPITLLPDSFPPTTRNQRTGAAATAGAVVVRFGLGIVGRVRDIRLWSTLGLPCGRRRPKYLNLGGFQIGKIGTC
jgi:hypothetical protein